MKTFVFICVVAWSLAARVVAAEAVPPFPVDQFVLSYGREHPSAPPLSLLTGLTVQLGRTPEGTLVGEGGTPVTIKLSDPQPAGTTINEDALRKIFGAIVVTMNTNHFFGIVAMVSHDQIDPQSKADLRPATDHSLKIIVWFSEVAQVRSVAKGTRFAPEQSISNPKHSRIVADSPLKPAEGTAPGSLFDKEKLDDYLRRLNRQPGRSVEAAISSTEDPGRVMLDYLVTERKAWLAYAQVSNTGTSATDKLREHVGFVQNQLFNRDDIASIDYITSNFSKANAVFGSYNYPLWYPDRLRARVFGSWGDFNATTPESAVSTGSTAAPPDKFSGDSWTAGGELIASPFSLWGFALDLTAGAMAEHVEVNNKSLQLQGKADLFTPYVSGHAEHTSEVWTASGTLGWETSFKHLDQQQMVLLGRLDTQDTYNLFRGEVNASTYLEPIFFGLSGNNDWHRATMAHEITFQARGQYVPRNDRLIPQKEEAIGGYFSVRGYPESAVAGDNVFTASGEYRFHIPRALQPTSEKKKEQAANEKSAQDSESTLFGRPFNYRPAQMYARPDWDLIARAFLDAGYSQVNLGTATERRAGENNYSLLSTGLGLELQMLTNVNLRADWGYTLRGIKTGIQSPGSPYSPGPNDTSSGSSRLHVLMTLVW